MESTAFNQAGWNPLHLIWMQFTMLHGMYCIQSRCMEFTAFNWDPLHHDAWNPLRSIKIHCIQSGRFGPCWIISTAFNRDSLGLAAWNPLHSIMLHGIHCIQSRSIGPRCMESTAFNWDPFRHASWNTLRSIGMHFTMLHGIHCIQ